MTPFIGRQVILNNDPSKVYTVCRYVLASYYQSEPCPGVTTWTVSSVLFNGVEQLGAPAVFPIDKNDNETLYFGFDVTTNVSRTLDPQPDTVGPTDFYSFWSGFSLSLKTLLEDDLDLPVKVGQSWQNYMENVLSVNLNGEDTSGVPSYVGILLEKEEKDSIEITYSYTNPQIEPCFNTITTDVDGAVIRLVFDGVDAFREIDGVRNPVGLGSPITYSWDYETFLNSSEENGIPTLVDSCNPQTTPPYFNSDIEFDCTSCETECHSLSFTDDSTIINTFAGHDEFGYRLIRLVRPDGTVYEYSSAESDNPDQIIPVLTATGVNSFVYNFNDTDVDGVWGVQVYNFPEWNEDVVYNSMLGVIVHRNDNIYLCIESNVGVDPENDEAGIYWAEYEITDDTLNTRYGSVDYKAVLCISLIGCYKKLIEEAFCSDKSDPCATLCENKKFQNAMKVRVIWDAIKSSECRNDWSEVINQINIWKNICNCVNC